MPRSRLGTLREITNDDGDDEDDATRCFPFPFKFFELSRHGELTSSLFTCTRNAKSVWFCFFCMKTLHDLLQLNCKEHFDGDTKKTTTIVAIRCLPSFCSFTNLRWKPTDAHARAHTHTGFVCACKHPLGNNFKWKFCQKVKIKQLADGVEWNTLTQPADTLFGAVLVFI